MKKLIFSLGFAFALILQGSFALPALAQYSGYGYTTPAYPSYPQQTCPAITYNLYRGVSDRYTGGQVSQLQAFLASRYGAQAVTGYFGPQTAANVVQFQREQGVYPLTGGVGPLTRAAIARVCGTVTVPPVPTQSIFYLNTPFSLSVGQFAKEYQGQLDVTLSQINTGPYYYWGASAPVSARVALGQSCAAGTYCAALWYPSQTVDLTLGQSTTFQSYIITLTALTSTTATFTVTKMVPSETGLSVTYPTQGQTVARGQNLAITWNSNTMPTGSALVLDLYTAQGSKVGTIAIQSSSSSSGTYNWSVPVPNTVCTMQYPNGLCGQSLSGQYYIKASLVSGSGFDSNPTTYSSANSGTFTVY